MISRDLGTTLYEQVRRSILEMLRSGGLGAHARLPSERRLVEELGVSRITVRRALGDLVREGYLYAVPGKGFFVAAREQPYELNALLSFSAAARSRGVRPSSRVLEAVIRPAPPPLALQLRIPAGANVVSLRRLRMLDGLPAMIQHSWLPHSACPGILDTDLEHTSLYDELSSRHGVVLASGRTVISARLAEHEEERLLELETPSAVLTVDQVTFTREGRPVEVSRSVYHPERYPLSIVHDDGRGPGRARAWPI